MLRTIVVDDSIIFRKVMRDALSDVPDIQVVDIAKDGVTAVEKIVQHKPDLVTLDVEMPGLNGLEVLKEIRKRGVNTNVIMVSSLTSRGAEVTTQALSRGAFDFILKPDSGLGEENFRTLASAIRERLSALSQRNRRVESAALASKSATVNTARSHVATKPSTQRRVPDTATQQFDLVVIGISTGGPKALSHVIPRLPSEFPIPLLVVQHMPPMFTATMARNLDGQSNVSVLEASDGLPVAGRRVAIAPGGYQMAVSKSAGSPIVKVSDAPAIKSCKPSVDYLMKSIDAELASRTLAIIMTGMGDDGLDGCTHVKQRGGQVWTQSAETCTVYGMPKQVQDAGLSDATFDLDELPMLLSRLKPRSIVTPRLATNPLMTNLPGGTTV